VIGASAGGVAALQDLAAELPTTLRAAVCVVLHIGRHRSELPRLLARAGPLPATQAEDGEPLREGHIHIAAPDHHLLIESGHLRLVRGPRENFARPAIDPLFRSAAADFGRRTTGVILSGRMNDGTAGLYEIKRCGGTAVVQTPEEAQYRDMPVSALQYVAVDHCLRLAEMPAMFERVARETVEQSLVPQHVEEASEMTTAYRLNRPTALTCPDCGGAVEPIELGKLTQYRCHIGHSYTAEAMAAAQFAQMESGVEVALRMLNERIEVCRQMAERPGATDATRRAAWLAAMEQAEQRADSITELLSAGWLSAED
jgi:two-component system chemotaxis response regulator CheB